MGKIQINLNFNQVGEDQLDNNFGVYLHEITHILGMSKNLWNYWIDPDTGKRRGEYNVKRSYGALDYIITPKVVKHVNRHFGCRNGSLLGAPLENQGGGGSAGSHWEKRFFGGDYMVSINFPNNNISDLSVAMFEDSGWYSFGDSTDDQGRSPNAEPLFWLKGAGCKVYTQDCPGRAFTCNRQKELGCSFDYAHEGVCEDAGNSDGCNYY
jgi:hypothetical protein